MAGRHSVGTRRRERGLEMVGAARPGCPGERPVLPQLHLEHPRPERRDPVSTSCTNSAAADDDGCC